MLLICYQSGFGPTSDNREAHARGGAHPPALAVVLPGLGPGRKRVSGAPCPASTSGASLLLSPDP